jgi:hypothetical protein
MRDSQMLARVMLMMLGVMAAGLATAYPDSSAPSADPEPAVDTAPAAPVPADTGDEHTQVRDELQQREDARAQARQQNCAHARSELQRLGDVPARNVFRTTEDGSTARMTEEEHAAHLAKMRAAETENCQ